MESGTTTRKVLFLSLSLTLGILWSLLAAHFLMRFIGPGIFLIILFVIFPLCVAIYETVEKGRKSIQIVFLAVLVVSGGFLGCLRVGLAESVLLEDDSFMDVSNSVISLHVRNRGLSDIDILKVFVGNVSFDLKLPFTLTLTVGMDGYLQIHYGRRQVSWGKTLGWPSLSRYEEAYTTNVDVTPLTFTNGTVYPVAFHTSGLLSHSFSLKAEATSEEGLVMESYHAGKDSTVNMYLQFNNSVASQICHIYNMQIGNVTFSFEPTYPVFQTDLYQEIVLQIGDWFDTGFSYVIHGGAPLSYEMTAEPKPTVSMFEKNETYRVTIWTMTNKHYNFNIVIT